MMPKNTNHAPMKGQKIQLPVVAIDEILIHMRPGHPRKLPGFIENAPPALQRLMKSDPSVKAYLNSMENGTSDQNKIRAAIPILPTGLLGDSSEETNGLHVTKSNARLINDGDDSKRKASLHAGSERTTKRAKKQDHPGTSYTKDNPSKETPPTPPTPPPPQNSMFSGLEVKSTSTHTGSVVSTTGQGIKREPAPKTKTNIIMQDPTDQAEASIPTEHVINGPDLNRTFTVRRKWTKRALPWNLTARALNLVPPPPQDEDIREPKRPRLEKASPTSTDEAIERASVRVGNWTAVEDVKLKDAVKTHGGKNWVAIAALVPGRTRRQCSDRWHNALVPSADRATVRADNWTAVEDSKLKDAFQIHDGKNWGAIASLVSDRTPKQCRNRWQHFSIPTPGRRGKWTEDDVIKLKAAVQTHGKDWAAIAELVPGRTKGQCRSTWKNVLDPNIDRATPELSAFATKTERSQLGADFQPSDLSVICGQGRQHSHTGNRRFRTLASVFVERYSGAVNRTTKVALVSGVLTTIRQAGGHFCRYEKGAWFEVGDRSAREKISAYFRDMLHTRYRSSAKAKTSAVQMHRGKDLDAVTLLVPGRTQNQCQNRWHHTSNNSVVALGSGAHAAINPTTTPTGKWTADEDKKLRDAVRTHGCNYWVKITAVPRSNKEPVLR
jgi:hypothetical protein